MAFLVIKVTFVYDLPNPKREIFTIPFYMFFFNIGDSLGKFTPHKIVVENTKFIHFVCFGFLVFFVYFMKLLLVETTGFTENPIFRIFVILLMGLLNGYNTSNFMCRVADRFEKPVEKGKSGYYSVMFLLIGITLGTFLNTTMT